jgi:hypothetical protein
MSSKTGRSFGDWIRSGEGIAVGFLGVFFATVLLGSLGMRATAALFPRVIGTAGLLCLVLIWFQAFNATPTSRTVSNEEEDDFRQASPRTRFLALAAAPAYGLIFWLAGFYVAAAATIFGIPMLLGYRRPVVLAVLAAVSTLLIGLLFSTALDLQMPHGLIGNWFFEKYVYSD